ncbi:MAG: LamG-like jellyroll fold domain-containing protein [Phycisphaeraceae bacterium]
MIKLPFACAVVAVLFGGSLAAGQEAVPATDVEALRRGMTFYAPFEDADLAAWHAGGNPRELAGGRGGTLIEGKVGSAVLLADKGHLTYATRSNLDGMSATLSFWIRPDTGNLSKYVADSTRGFWSHRFFSTSWNTQGRVYITFMRANTQDKLSFYFYDWHPTGPRPGAGTHVKPEALAGWHHVVCQWGDGHKRMFLDGELMEDTKAQTGWSFGTRFDFNAWAGPTAYDELAVWGRALSAEEVQALYKLGQAGKKLIDKRAPAPAEPAPSWPAPGTNLLRNGGFELGLSRWEFLYPPLKRADVLDTPDTPDTPDSPGADAGLRSLKIHPRPKTGRNEGSPRIVQGPFPVRAGRRHTVSIYLKSSAAKASATVFLTKVQDATGDWADLRKKVTLTDQWQKVELTGVPEGGDQCLAYLGVQFDGQGDGFWWADQAAVYQGDADTKLPLAGPFEFALSTDKIANIFRKGEQVQLRLEGLHPRTLSRSSVSVPLTLSVEDLDDRQVLQMEVKGAIEPGKVTEQFITLPMERLGPMRAVLRWGDEVLDELNFTVIPFTHAQSDELGQFLGGELNPNDWHCASAVALGLRWAFPLDVSPATQWRNVEAEKGTFKWNREEDIALYRKWGLNVLGWIDHAPKWAVATQEWKSAPAREHLDAFENYVYQTVNHYKGQVDHWLIWDEMDQQAAKRGGSVELYLEMIERAHRAAHKADPDCKVLSPASSGNVAWVSKLVDLGVLKYTDVFSCDLWSTRYSTIARLAALSGADGKRRPFWDHGTGASSRTFYRYILPEPQSTRDTMGTHRGAADEMAKLLIDRRAAGVEKMFFYWIVKKQCAPSHAAISFYEYDGSIRPFAAAFSILGQYLYQYEPVGPLRTPSNLTGFLFRAKADGAPLAVLYADRRGFVADDAHVLRQTGRSARLAGDPRSVLVRLDTTLKPDQYLLRDLMLNPTDEGVRADAGALSVWIGESPVLIEGRGLSVEAFEQALSPAADAQP